MPIKKKDFSNKPSLSKSNDKRGKLLIRVDELMEKLDNEYGPFLLDELQKRLETTIEDFHTDLKTVLEGVFKAHDLKLDQNNRASNKDGTAEVPKFIAKYEEKIKNKK